ncbi:MAG: tRNA (adenosine(37)-N6)-threonylcarbamoyltransferase complex dimerization subunit type 1 TsaB [Clostridiales bacterium]|nr:tRNA (adenosine(37)-N6)-threonylcarbamoyltransferase complex dimerization subunit type 1 TsaB [Clostridiales bacterium]
MIILAIDSTAKTAGAAVIRDNILVSECYTNSGLTHSKTMLRLIDNCLSQAELKLSDINMIAVNNGPGSFTGVRIGVSLVKGLSFDNGIPVCAVSALDSIAYNFINDDCYVLSCMDARCEQIYWSFYCCENGRINKLKPDSADKIDLVKAYIEKYKDNKILISGDGSDILFEKCKDNPYVVLADNIRKKQNGISIAAAAENIGNTVSSDILLPLYLRPSQAEREKIVT